MKADSEPSDAIFPEKVHIHDSIGFCFCSRETIDISMHTDTARAFSFRGRLMHMIHAYAISSLCALHTYCHRRISSRMDRFIATIYPTWPSLSSQLHTAIVAIINNGMHIYVYVNATLFNSFYSSKCFCLF